MKSMYHVSEWNRVIDVHLLMICVAHWCCNLLSHFYPLPLLSVRLTNNWGIYHFNRGRLFLSPRIAGFYANIFGRKTKFFFLWEDIDDIHVVPPKLATVGSPSLMIILRKDRGLEARHGAKTLDPQGRLKFHFQTFVSFNDAHRYGMR